MKEQKTFHGLGMNKVLVTLLMCVSLLLNVQHLNAQNSKMTVKGQVKDVVGELIIGASVVEKGSTATGTVTDLNGNFTLTVSPRATLIVSYIGYVTQEIPVNGKSMLNVTLKDDTQALDEVVVVGFGSQKKVNLTGSVGLASGKDLESRPVMNAVQALQGLVPGLQISTNTGELDKDMSLNVRGTGTIGSGTNGSPLVLIDGMEGDLNAVNPQDIESVSVLKDAAASSIYGSRAPFGVILITTKKGKAGKANISYNNNFRISSPVKLPEMMDSYTFANFFNEGKINSGDGAFFDTSTMQKMLDFQAAGGTNRGGLPTDGIIWGKPAGDPYQTAYANTDWYAELYRDNSFSQEHNLSINGGTEKVTYYASLGFLDQKGLLNYGEDGLKRYNVTAKMNAELTSWLDFSYSLRFVRSDNRRPSRFSNGLYDNIGRQTWSNLPVYDENGFFHDSNGGGLAMGLEQGGNRNVQTDKLYHQATLVIEPIKNWLTHVEFNYSTNSSEVRETELPCYNHKVDGTIDDTKGTSSLYQDHKKENYLNLNLFSEYGHTFAENHNFKIMAGFQAEDMRQSFFSAKKYGLLIEDLFELDLTNSLDGAGVEKIPEAGGYRNQWTTAGFFGRLNYDYQGRYLAEVNMRYDGSSRFRQGNRWQFSPSFSLGWNVAREAFWQPLAHVVGTLKFRGSYGELGNQNTSAWYPTYRAMELKTANGGWLQNGVKPNTAKVGDLISTALTWETVRTWNIGLDWGLFNNRLTGAFDVYTRYTDNMVGPAPELPNVLGIATPKTNNCDLKTAGWELEIAWNDRLRNGLGYSAKLLLSDTQTTIESYPGNLTNSIWEYTAGRNTGEIWGYKTVGIAQTQEEMDAHLANVGGQSFGSEWGAGDIMYADLDGKPGITEGAGTQDDHGDLTVIGNNNARYHFGIDFSADWKGFDFRCFFQGVMKRDYWQGSSMFWGATEDFWWSTGLKEHGDYFRGEAIGLNGEIPANLDAYYPRPLFGGNGNGPKKNHKTQDRYQQDASYIRLKNLQVGYTLPGAWTRKVGFEKFRLFVSGENLWTGSSLSKLFDPETISGGKSDSGGGNAYPLSRTWSFGLSITL